MLSASRAGPILALLLCLACPAGSVQSLETAETGSKGGDRKNSTKARGDLRDKLARLRQTLRREASPSLEAPEGLLPRYRLRRPHLGGPPEFVRFGIYIKAIDSVDIVTGTYVADLVLTLSWTDSRCARLVPAGHDFMTMSKKTAEGALWYPDVVVSNRALDGGEEIASTFNVTRWGTVLQVDRFLVLVRNTFSTHDFPFDMQRLQIKLASKTHMTNELQFVPFEDHGMEGIGHGVMRNSEYKLEDWSHSVVVEQDGPLAKSRGIFEVVLKRDPTPYIQNVIVPCVLLLGISYSAFWFPQTVPFAMPRAATALFAFLCYISLSLKTQELMPPRAGLAWMDVFEAICQNLMFFTVCFNIAVMVIVHKYGRMGLAGSVQWELRLIFPLAALALFGLCFWDVRGPHRIRLLLGITTLTWIVAVGYIVVSINRVHTDPKTPRTPTSPKKCLGRNPRE